MIIISSPESSAFFLTFLLFHDSSSCDYIALHHCMASAGTVAHLISSIYCTLRTELNNLEAS